MCWCVGGDEIKESEREDEKEGDRGGDKEIQEGDQEKSGEWTSKQMLQMPSM